MNYNILKTGSAGNCIVLGNRLALDMGVPINMLQPVLRSLRLVFLSHEHSDHINLRTISHIALHRPTVRFCGGPWVTEKIRCHGVSPRQIDILNEGYWYDYGFCQVSPVSLIHDVPNYGLRVRMNDERILYAVDTATMSGVIARNYDLYLIEGNYGEEEIQERIRAKEEAGQYVYEYDAMRRHMSKEAAMAWLAENAGPASRYELIHGHVKKNG